MCSAYELALIFKSDPLPSAFSIVFYLVLSAAPWLFKLMLRVLSFSRIFTVPSEWD